MLLAAVRAIHGPWQVSAQVREVSPGANATRNCLLCLERHKINDVQATKPGAQSVRYPRIRWNNTVVSKSLKHVCGTFSGHRLSFKPSEPPPTLPTPPPPPTPPSWFPLLGEFGVERHCSCFHLKRGRWPKVSPAAISSASQKSRGDGSDCPALPKSALRRTNLCLTCHLRLYSDQINAGVCISPALFVSNVLRIFCPACPTDSTQTCTNGRL